MFLRNLAFDSKQIRYYLSSRKIRALVLMGDWKNENALLSLMSPAERVNVRYAEFGKPLNLVPLQFWSNHDSYQLFLRHAAF